MPKRGRHLRLTATQREAIIQKVTEAFLARLSEAGLLPPATLHDVAAALGVREGGVVFVDDDGRLVLEADGADPTAALRVLELTLREARVGAERFGIPLRTSLAPTVAETEDGFTAVAIYKDGR